MEPAAANGSNALANLTPAELAQQARQRDGARQAQRPADVQPTRNDTTRPEAARAVRTDSAEVPAVRASDLTQRAQFALTTAEAARQNAGDASADFQQPEIQTRIGPEPPGENLRASFDTEALQRDPDPLVGQDGLMQDDGLNRGDIAQPDNTARAYGAEPGGTAADPERAAQFRELSEQAQFLQNAATSGNGQANDNAAERPEAGADIRNTGPSTNDQAAEHAEETGISMGGTAGDAAGPTLPRGSTLSLVA
jgi:hypothetical protein